MPAKEQRFTFVIVTHTIEEAAYLGQSILVLGRTPNQSGRIFSNPVFGQPAGCDSATFRELCATLRVELEER
jgi:ABC-type nitrate/sulfonate/bicarbonate transport system ATPase subunit